jgi:predicted DNA-binding transcriptional regulator YafY
LIQLDIMDNIPGSEHLNDLVESLKSRYVCSLFYKKFGSQEAKEYQFEPYMLKEFDALWYVTGKLSDTEDYRTFALDRIQKVTLSNIFFVINKDFNREVYYNSVYGVTHINESPSKVVLRVDHMTARFLSIRPIHKSQRKTYETGDFVRFEIDLVLNPEIETKLMSLGNGCVVESPAILKNSIKDKLKKALENYE